MGRPPVRHATAVIALLVLSSCTAYLGPARTEQDFARKASTTAKSVRSAIEVARIAAETSTKGNAFATYASVILSEAEDDASGAQSTFDKFQPPNATADQQREEL